jgi:signal transduction histidine kinase
VWIAAAESSGAVVPADQPTDPSRITARTAALTITIADDGAGIAAELGDRIFDAYVSTKETGLGLGLAICRRIVQSHGGQITADIRAEGGAIFTICLPTHVPSDPRRAPCPAYS